MLADRWLVPKDPTSELRPGLAPVPGAGYRNDCYISQSIPEGHSWAEYEGHTERLRKAGLALKLLSLIGFTVDLDRFKSSDIKTWGWKSYKPINLDPNPNTGTCFGESSTPRYWAVGEVLVFDSLDLTLVDRSGHKLNLKLQNDLSTIVKQGDSLRWEVSDSNRVRAKGQGLAVGYHLLAWKVVSNSECRDDFSTLLRGMRPICAAEDNSKLSLGVDSVGRNGKYYLVARDDSKPQSHEQRDSLKVGGRWDLDATGLRWARVFIEESERGAPYVRFRYARTSYETRPLLTASSLPPATADSLSIFRP